MQSLRMALVGKLTGPDLFEICKVLGKDVTLKRIDQAISYFNLKSKSL
jgi:glutamyl-tRNA synthetase